MFSLTEEQEKELLSWMENHEVVYEGAIGGRYTYKFTPTSLGVIAKVKDCITKTEIDLTDYDAW